MQLFDHLSQEEVWRFHSYYASKVDCDRAPETYMDIVSSHAESKGASLQMPGILLVFLKCCKGDEFLLAS